MSGEHYSGALAAVEDRNEELIQAEKRGYERGYEQAVEDGFQQCDPAADQGGSSASEVTAAIWAAARRAAFEEAAQLVEAQAWLRADENTPRTWKKCIEELLVSFRARAAEEGSDAS